MADWLRLTCTWSIPTYIQFLTLFYTCTCLFDVDGALFKFSQRDHYDLGNDRYEMSNGSPDWCLYCHAEDLTQSFNFEPQCEEKNPLPDNITHDKDLMSNVIWCHGRGKPPTCSKPELPVHTKAVPSDTAHLYYTHTYLTLSCEAGFRREPMSPFPYTLACQGNPPQWNSSGLETFKCVTNSSLDMVMEPPRNLSNNTKTPVQQEYPIRLIVGLSIFGVFFGVGVGVSCWCKRRQRQADTGQTSQSVGENGDGVTDSFLKKVGNEKTNEIELDSPKDTGLTSSQDNNNVQAQPPTLTGDPTTCNACINDLEKYDNGREREEIVKVLNLDEHNGRDKSWIALGITELGLSETDILDKKRRFGKERDGPAAYILTQMGHYGKKMGHLVLFLHNRFPTLEQRILLYHKNCPCCDQSGEDNTTNC